MNEATHTDDTRDDDDEGYYDYDDDEEEGAGCLGCLLPVAIIAPLILAAVIASFDFFEWHMHGGEVEVSHKHFNVGPLLGVWFAAIGIILGVFQGVGLVQSAARVLFRRGEVGRIEVVSFV